MLIKNESIKKGMMEVDSAENLEQLKEAVLSVFTVIDEEIDFLVVNKRDIR